MTESELTAELKRMYDSAPHGESTTMIHLFGIMYVDELKNRDISVARIATNSVGPAYHTEISKGIRLAKYVDLKGVDKGFCGKEELSQYAELIAKVLGGGSDTNIAFDDLRNLLKRLGFVERIKGGHHTFRKGGVAEKTNLQRFGGNAKPYQVRQVRNVLVKYRLLNLEEWCDV